MARKLRVTAAKAHNRPLVDRVYFVGAGFSAGIGYPLGSKLLPMIVKRLRGLDDQGKALKHGPFRKIQQTGCAKSIVECLQHMLDQFFGVRQSLLRANAAQINAVFEEVDLAEFFTIAQAVSEDTSPIPHELEQSSRHSAREASFSRKDLYSCLAAVTRTCFVQTFLENKAPASVTTVLDRVDPQRHAIVTYNWDEEIEYFLCVEKGDVAYTLEDWQVQSAENGSVFLLLKPHGSVGWYDVGQGVTNSDLLFVAGEDKRLPRQRRRVAGYYEVELPRDLDKQDHQPHECPPVITPPTYSKRFTYEEQQLIWRDTFRVCAHAREFVFLGYSLARDDFWTRTAIRCALYHQRGKAPVRVVVVNRDWSSDLLNNFRSVFGDGFVQRRHVQVADFSSPDRDLADQIELKMKSAVVRSV